jgi:hypothetical protein
LSDPPHGRRRELAALARSLDSEQRLAGIGAAGILVSMFTPWWRDPVFGLSSWAVNRLTFDELALTLVAGSVLLLLYRRAQGRVFHLPLSDGTLEAGAGLWSCVIVIARALDPPTRTVKTEVLDYDVRWGLLLCLASAALLAVAGIRARRRHHPGERESVAADADAVPTLPLPR